MSKSPLKLRAPHRHDEDDLHAAIATNLRANLDPDVFWFHYPSGGFRHIGTAVRLKLFGTLSGVPDLYFRWSGTHLPWATGWIEVKAKDGRLSPEQREFLRRAIAMGDLAAVCRSVSDVTKTLKQWGVPFRSRTTQPLELTGRATLNINKRYS